MTATKQIATPRQQTLMRSTTVVSSMTMLSRVLGFVRDIIIAQMFGAMAGVDAFLVAFKIPNFMRRLFAEGAFSQAFVPVLSEYQQCREDGDVRQFISRIAGNLSAILFLVTLFSVIATPILIMIFAPGFIDEPTRFNLAVYMLRITFPYLMLISLTAMAGAILNTYGSFAIPAFTPVLLNISLICAALFASPHFVEPVTALAWGVLVAGIAQLLFQLPFLWGLGLLPKPQIAFHDEGVKRVLRLMIPALFGVSVAQINLLLDTVFASFLTVGSVSWLYYSDRLTNFPLGVFGVAISTVIMPHLSRKHAAKSPLEFAKTLDWAMRVILLIALPATFGLFILAGPLLGTLFNYGKFGAHDVAMARLSLMAFALGLPAFMLIKVLASGFYAQQNIKTPVKVGVVAMISNIFLNLALIYPLSHAGLALATSISAYINAITLYVILRRQGIYQVQPGWSKFRLQMLAANGLMACFLVYCHGPLTQWLVWNWMYRASYLAALIIGAMIAYLVTLYLLGMRISDYRGRL